LKIPVEFLSGVSLLATQTTVCWERLCWTIFQHSGLGIFRDWRSLVWSFHWMIQEIDFHYQIQIGFELWCRLL
jgi:hypothetical protein